MPDEVITLEKGRGSVPITSSSSTVWLMLRKERRQDKKAAGKRGCVCASHQHIQIVSCSSIVLLHILLKKVLNCNAFRLNFTAEKEEEFVSTCLNLWILISCFSVCVCALPPFLGLFFFFVLTTFLLRHVFTWNVFLLHLLLPGGSSIAWICFC